MSAPRAYPRLRCPGALCLSAGLIMVGGLVLQAPAASATYGPPGPPQASPSVAVPLSGSVTGSATTWATVLMGRNDGEFDLFWQLFSLNARTGHFALVTPPGVADNGGLMVAPDATGTTALVGIGASQGLTFSPLALTANRGETWIQGGLPDALDAAPSVLGFDTAGDALALVNGTAQTVLDRSGSLTSWKTIATRDTLANTPAGHSCVIGSLEAVALGPGEIPLVGASCREPDTPGVFVDSDAQWHLADIPIPVRLVDDLFAVVRLQPSSALFAAVHGKTASIVAAWEPTLERPWALSPPLAVGSIEDLIASGTGPGETQFVLVRDQKTVRAEIVSGPGANWHSIPPLPRDVATLAFAPNGTLYALGVNDTLLYVWRLAASRQSWVKAQTIKVPIVFGSSA